MQLKTLFTSIAIIFSACESTHKEKELYGKYSQFDCKNTFDTIELKPNGIYRQTVFDKNNKLVLDLNGKWDMPGRNEVRLETFFLNLDRDVSKFPELLTDPDFSITTYIETRKGVIEFCVGYYQDSNCYKKIN